METTTKKTTDLAVHPAIATLPALATDSPEMSGLVDSVRTHGILAPLLIDSDDQVIDGRHRLKAAKLAGLTTVPCRIVDATEANSLALESLMARRHYTKGALAYMALGLFEQASEEGKKRGALGRPKKGADSVGTLSAEGLAERLGVSTDLFRQAQKVAKLVTDSIFARADWLAGDDDLEASWDAWNQDTPDAWQTFLAQIEKDGHNFEENPPPPLPEYIESALADLFDGETGLGGILQGAAGLITAGKPRADRNPDNGSPWVYAQRAIQNIVPRAFGQWDKIDPEHRAPVLKTLAQSVGGWPADAQAAVLAALQARN